MEHFWLSFLKEATVGATAGRYAMNLVKQTAKPANQAVQRAATAATAAAKATPQVARPAATFANVAKRARSYAEL